MSSNEKQDLMKVKIELTSGEIKEYEVYNYVELISSLRKEGITADQIKKIL